MFIFCLARIFLDRVFFRVSYTCSSNYSVYDEVYTHSLVARTFFCCTVFVCAQPHIFMRVTYTHGSSAWKGSLHMCRFSPSRRLPSHDSPILAVPARSLRNQSRQRLHWLRHPHDLAELSRPKSAGQAHSARGWAVWLPGQVPSSHRLWAQGVRQDHFCGYWHDTHQWSEPRFLRLLENPRTRTLANSVFLQCLNPLFCTFLMGDVVPQRESKESMQSGNRC